MVSHLVFYQLGLIVLVWVFLMLSGLWPSAPAAARPMPNLDTVSFTYMRSAADCVLRAHPRPSENPERREEGRNHSTAYRPTHCFYCAWLLITTSCQLRGSFLSFLRQPQGFRLATR
jgi:hypothetical protein